MDIRYFTVGPFLEHTYLLSDLKAKEAIIIDPGGWSEKVLSYVKKENLRVTMIVSTHGHIDHIAGAYELRKKTEAPYRLNKKDEFLLEKLNLISSYFGFPNVEKPIVDEDLGEKDILYVGKYEIRVIETPGHTPGSLCFLIENYLFSGDTLFQGSIGRTDLPGGNYDQLIRSIQAKLLVLDDDLTVYCGHGEKTTIGVERKTNPFLSGGNASFF